MAGRDGVGEEAKRRTLRLQFENEKYNVQPYFTFTYHGILVISLYIFKNLEVSLLQNISLKTNISLLLLERSWKAFNSVGNCTLLALLYSRTVNGYRKHLKTFLSSQFVLLYLVFNSEKSENTAKEIREHFPKTVFSIYNYI